MKIKLELKGKPLVDSKFNFKQENPSYPVYIETKNKIYIPKMFGIEKYGFPETVLENYIGKEWDNPIEFNGTLLERQIEPVNALIKACKEKGGGILEAGTGTGKTFMGLYVLSKLKVKTIVVVNKIPIMNQWKSEIEKFLPGIKVGTLQGQKNVDINNCDIVVAMLQSMARIDYPDALFVDFGCVIIDEVHNLASKVFSQILFKLCCKYTIGLSATPKRADGCEYVFKWHLGNIVYKSNEKRKGKPPIIRLLKIETNEYKEVSTENKFTGQKQIQFTSMLSELVEMSKRNLLILDLIKDLIKKDSNRKILVLSDRRNHLLNLDNDLDVTFTYGLFLGSMKQAALTQSRASNVIMATFAAFSEGVSERDLDTLILCSPKKFIGHMQNKIVKNESGKLEQIVGRVFRKDHIERNPIIVDLQDQFSVYKTQAKSRVIFYKQHFSNGIFQEESINLDDHENVSVTFIKTKKRTEQVDKIENLENNILNKCCIIDD
jgi:superfamily II DNA or RNA helicase